MTTAAPPLTQRQTCRLTFDVTVKMDAYTSHNSGEMVADSLPLEVQHYLRHSSHLSRHPVVISYQGRHPVLLAREEIAQLVGTTFHAMPPGGNGMWVTSRITVDVTLDPQSWIAHWGLPPQHALAAHLAAEISQDQVFRHHYRATVVPVPPAPVTGANA